MTAKERAQQDPPNNADDSDETAESVDSEEKAFYEELDQAAILSEQ